MHEERRRNRDMIDEENPFERRQSESKKNRHEQRRDDSSSENEYPQRRRNREDDESEDRKKYGREEPRHETSKPPAGQIKKAVKSVGSTFRRLEKNLSKHEEELKSEIRSHQSQLSYQSDSSAEAVNDLDRLNSEGKYLNPNENLSRQEIMERYKKLIYV